MYLNTLQPAKGSKFKAKILGRGIGSGLGKTCGKSLKFISLGFTEFLKWPILNS